MNLVVTSREGKVVKELAKESCKDSKITTLERRVKVYLVSKNHS